MILLNIPTKCPSVWSFETPKHPGPQFLPRSTRFSNHWVILLHLSGSVPLSLAVKRASQCKAEPSCWESDLLDCGRTLSPGNSMEASFGDHPLQPQHLLRWSTNLTCGIYSICTVWKKLTLGGCCRKGKELQQVVSIFWNFRFLICILKRMLPEKKTTLQR